MGKTDCWSLPYEILAQYFETVVIYSKLLQLGSLKLFPAISCQI